MNITLDFTSSCQDELEQQFLQQSNSDETTYNSAPELSVDNRVPWVVDQLALCNIHISEEKLEESHLSDILVALLDEKNKVNAQNKKLVDDYSRVRTQLNQHIRDKQTHCDQLAAMKQEVKFSAGRVSALQQEHRAERNHWVEEKADLESKVFKMLGLQTGFQSALRKKEKDYEKLQSQLSKAVKDQNKAAKATVMAISKPIKQNSSQLNAAERTEANAAALRAAEVASLRQYVHQLEQEKVTARCAHQEALATAEAALAAVTVQYRQQCAELQKEHECALQAARAEAAALGPRGEKEMGEEEEDGDGDEVPGAVDLNQTWNEVGSPTAAEAATTASSIGPASPLPSTSITASITASIFAESPAPGALVEEFLLPLTPTPHAMSLLQELAGAATGAGADSDPAAGIDTGSATGHSNSNADTAVLRQQLAEALTVIREQDRLIHEAIVGKLPSWTTLDESGCIYSSSSGSSSSSNTNVSITGTPLRNAYGGASPMCPDSIMKILAPGRKGNSKGNYSKRSEGKGAFDATVEKENVGGSMLLSPVPLLAALEKEIFDEASPYTQSMLKATGMYSQQQQQQLQQQLELGEE